MEDSEENEEAKRLARNLIEQANRGEMVEISGWLYSSTVIAAALQIFVRACQDGTCRAVEELYIDVQDEIVAPSLRNLFQNCPNLREVRGLPFTNGGYRVLMEAINEGMCPNVKILKLCGHKMNNLHVAPLVRAIENGKLKSVETLDLKNYGPVEKRDVNAIVSAFSTGHCFNLEELVITNHENCDASVAEKFVGAIADQRFPRLRAVPGRLFDPEEMSDKSKWEAAKNILARNLAEYWIEESSREKKELRIDGEENHSSTIASALEIFGRACQDGKHRSPERLKVVHMEDESIATSLWNVFQNCPNLRKVELTDALAIRVFVEAVTEGMCPKLEELCVCIDHSEAPLARAIQNGHLKNLRELRIDIDWSGTGPQSISDSVVSALINGECSNLESVYINGKIDAPNAEKFVHAIADKQFLKLREVDVYLVKLCDYLSVLQVPEEFADKDNESILSYLREGWQHGTEPLSVVKVVITGPGSVGKTCLVSRLVKNEFPEDARMTNGVDVTRKVEDSGLELVYYDFGGQPVYATTHQLFLRTRAVFLVAWDSRMETSDFMHQSFHQYARDLLDASPEAQIIFVTTKADQGYSALLEEDVAKLNKMYEGHFIGYHHVSALTEGDEGTDNLRNEISSLTNSVLHSIGGEHGFAGMLVPKTYVDLKQLVASLRDEANKFYLTPDDWKALAKSARIFEEKSVESVLSLFHEMGEVLRLPTGQIIVDPPKMTHVLSRIVTKDNRYILNARGGYLRHNELESVWADYDIELHMGFLQLLHECEIGYPIRDDDGRDYGATLIPAMLYSGRETMQEHVDRLKRDHHELKAGPRIIVETSTRSTRFGPKFLTKLRSITVLGGWWQNGCIIVDTFASGGSKSIRCYGTVSWTMDKAAVVTILTYGEVRLLRRRVLRALSVCLQDFPGVELCRLFLECSARPSCSGGWSSDKIRSTGLAVLNCLECGSRVEADDIADWIVSQTKRGKRADAQLQVKDERDGRRYDEWQPETSKVKKDKHSVCESLDSLEFLRRRLQTDSDASAEELCFLLLDKQDELLHLGCNKQNREKLNALWLVFVVNGRHNAYPLCPHLLQDSICVNDDLEVTGVSVSDTGCQEPLQRALNEVTTSILENPWLEIGEPHEGAQFTGILWKSMHRAKQLTKKNFKQVSVPEIGAVWVHKDDVAFFTDKGQKKLIEKLTTRVTELIKATRSVERRVLVLPPMLQTIQQGMNNIPELLVQMENVKCPYIFEFIDEEQYKAFKATLEEKKTGLESAVECAEEFEDFLNRARDLYESCKDFAREVEEDSMAALKRGWSLFVQQQKEVLYLQLLCGWTLEPIVTYKVETTKYPEWVKQLASTGGQGCAALVKIAILWNTAARIAGMLGYPAPSIPKEQLEQAEEFLTEINATSPVDELKESKSKGSLNMEDLWGLDKFLDKLESDNKMRHCFDELDKKELKDKTWKEALCKQIVSLKDDTKQVTFVSVKESGKFGSYEKADIVATPQDAASVSTVGDKEAYTP